MTKYDIHNPTQSKRVIRDGLVSTRIEIDPGKTLHGIELGDIVASRLMAIKGDLQLTVVPGSEDSVKPGILKIDEGGVTVVKAPVPVVPAGKKLDAKV